MVLRRLCFVLLLIVLAAIPIQAQTAQQLIQQIVDNERRENQNDHSQWIYLDISDKPMQHTLQWVATTPYGNVNRILTRDAHPYSADEQQRLMRAFIADPHAQKKQLDENAQDWRQVDSFLGLLPTGFLWTVTSTTPEATTLHFVPNPSFHPPTWATRAFAGMAGDLVADNEQRRVRSMHGQLIRDVTFGGGLLGRLKEGSTFSLEQQQVAPRLWQLTAIHVHLSGRAFFFHTVSMQQDEERSRFTRQPDTVALEQAASSVMRQPGSAQ